MEEKKKKNKEPGKITKITLEDRKSTFSEVSGGFTIEEALKEAQRCLQCKAKPCNAGCPASINIPEFVRLIAEKDFAGAIRTIKEENTLPGICGRVCPQEEQCQLKCVLNKAGKPIQIGYLERFAADWDLGLINAGDLPEIRQFTDKKTQGNRTKVAVIGAGPAGLTCATDLAKLGYEVHLFESLHKPGGVLVYGIPEFRLPKIIVEKEVEYVKSLGVNLRTDFLIGRTQTIDDLRRDGFKAFYIAVGAGAPQFMNIPGENSNGVYYANEFLTRINLMKGYRFPEYHTPVHVGKKVGIIGGGNVAFDCARCALRLGAEEVHMIYRRTKAEMSARHEEIENAEEEGIIFDLLVSPLRINSDASGKMTSIRCVKNELGEPDDSGRRSPQPVPGSEFELEMETAIVAIGTKANPIFTSSVPGLACSKRGYIVINEKYQTSIPDLFAGGDITSGSATVISAIYTARKAARAMDEFLKGLTPNLTSAEVHKF